MFFAKREQENHRSSCIGFTGYIYLSLVQQHQVFCQCQADTTATVMCLLSFLALIEPVENVRYIYFRYADSRVLHADTTVFKLIFFSYMEIYLYSSLVGCKLKSVG